MSHRSSGGFRGRGRLNPYRLDRPKSWRQGQEDDGERLPMERERIVEERSLDAMRSMGEGPLDMPPPPPPPEGEFGNGPPGELSAPGSKREKKFSNKSRLFVGNLPRDMMENDIRKLFEPFGEVQEVFLQKEKSFGFVRLAYRSEAERAVATLNGSMLKGRDIKVRFAASSCSIKVSNLNPVVSNELLEDAFSVFGEVESAVVVTDERGKSLGYGIIDFARKAHAMSAIQRCRNGQFLLTKSPIPVIVTEFKKDDDEEGLPEKTLIRNNNFYEERELPPRFAQPNSLEFAIAARWKQAYDEEKIQKDELEQRLKVARNDIQKEMEVIKEQHRTNLLRQEFARHQEEGMRLAEQLRRRGDSMGVNMSVLGMGFPPPPPGGMPPAPSLLQQPHGLGQGIPPAPLFPSPGGEMKSEGRVPLDPPPPSDDYGYGSGIPSAFIPPAPLLGQPQSAFVDMLYQ